MPRRRPDFGSGEAGVEDLGVLEERFVLWGEVVAAQPEGLGDGDGSQKQWLPDAGRADF